MYPSELSEAERRLEPQLEFVKSLRKGTPEFYDELRRLVEVVITVKGHAWSMDVDYERRKMARLLCGTIKDIFES